jgi:hypothetical protein
MVGQRLVTSLAVAAFIPAELCPDHLVAAGTLTPAGLLARDLGHERLLYLPVPLRILSPPRVGSCSLAELPGEASAVCAGDGRPSTRHMDATAFAVTAARAVPPVTCSNIARPSPAALGTRKLVSLRAGPVPGRPGAGVRAPAGSRQVGAGLSGQVRTGDGGYRRDMSHWCRSPAATAAVCRGPNLHRTVRACGGPSSALRLAL